MKKYQSHKVVEAGKIISIERFANDPHALQVTVEGDDRFPAGEMRKIPGSVFERPMQEGRELVGGYLVVYPDGYLSWSPAEAFEGGYEPLVHDPKNGALPVAGYQTQTDAKVQTVNGNKEAEESTLRILDLLAGFPGVDKRWLAIGRTSIEQGWMAVNRAIFQPSRVKLAGDPEAPGQDLD